MISSSSHPAARFFPCSHALSAIRSQAIQDGPATTDVDHRLAAADRAPAM
jgi:hypothetical protein